MVRRRRRQRRRRRRQLPYLALSDMVRSLNREHGTDKPNLRWNDFMVRAQEWTQGLSHDAGGSLPGNDDALLRVVPFLHAR